MDLCLKRLEHQIQREGDFRSAQTNKFDYTYNESGIEESVLSKSIARKIVYGRR
jgi:hypothetical protein